ncbi:U6 snRNA (guanine-N(2))-methyltransferase THUMPD2 [Danio rerio]|uniref:U6 snRNA (Guanine-N(2))-methyltransferase THUMPD2 n=1 Tax=Danio rerio TaxID=7955 RepID=A0AA70QG17_DANRE|nr:THUMP domain-containing protein 2 isoform X3 [Danio rerio]|eukprot:XP_021328843.1 THUMP domain-containing protein 2 isoform X3 [Danio rerio]
MRRLYCTAGAGMEELLAQEVRQKLCASQVEQIPGRVFFSTNAEPQTLTQLKSAERLFLLLHKAEPIALPNNPGKAAAVIKERVVGDPDIWKQTLLSWTAFQEELECRRDQGHKRKREEDEEESVTEADGSTHTVSSNTHLLEKQKEVGKESHLQTLSFRVSCRCSGVIARSDNPQRLSRIIGMAIKEQLGWKVDLREPVLEVNVYLSDDHCIVGIPLLKHPLASRSYMKHNGLRSTIAWAMTSLCPDELNNCVILDPMCGVGAVLLEAAQEYSNAVFLGMDTDGSQLQKAAENVKASGMEGRVQLLQSSALEIPLADGMVDAVLCDVPFGRKFSCSSDMTTALPLLLREMERVLRVGGHLVLLLSLQLSAQLKKIICTPEQEKHSKSLDTNSVHTEPSNAHKESTETHKTLLISSLQSQKKHRVSLGSTDAFIHTYTKMQTQTHSH